MLLLQEAMMEGKRVEEVMRNCVKYWRMESIDAEGHSGGILTAWSPEIKLLSETLYGSVLGTLLEDGETRLSYTIMNVYGPFYDKKAF